MYTDHCEQGVLACLHWYYCLTPHYVMGTEVGFVCELLQLFHLLLSSYFTWQLCQFELCVIQLCVFSHVLAFCKTCLVWFNCYCVHCFVVVSYIFAAFYFVVSYAFLCLWLFHYWFCVFSTFCFLSSHLFLSIWNCMSVIIPNLYVVLLVCSWDIFHCLSVLPFLTVIILISAYTVASLNHPTQLSSSKKKCATEVAHFV